MELREFKTSYPMEEGTYQLVIIEKIPYSSYTYTH